jgi:arabinogalactan oligomer/maltooligosaccharide transport system permease protein
VASEKTISATPGPVAVRASRGPRLGQRLRKGFDRWWFAYAMLAPTMVVMAALVFYPLVRGILYSFTNADAYTFGSQDVPATYQYIGLDNYRLIFQDPIARDVLTFTAVWTFVNVFFHFVLGLGLAVMLNRTMRFRGWYRMLLMVPWAVPSFISAFAWRYLYNNPYGFFTQAAKAIGWESPPAFLGDPFWAKVAVITANVWLGVPFMMVALLGGLQAIDRELLDAAEVDGASAWRRFWDVTMPGLRPVAATVILLGIIWTFNMFNIIFLITAGGPADATQILSTFAFRYFFDYQLFGVAAAYGVITLSILLLFGSAYRMLVRRLGEESWA